MKLEVSMPDTTRRQFTDAFKFEAVRLTREAGRPVAQVARDLGISDTVRYRSGSISLDRMFSSLSGALRWSAYAAVCRVGRLSKYTPSGV